MNILYSVEEKLIVVNKLVCWGKYVKAKRLLEEILEEEPDQANAHFEMAKIYGDELHDYARAETHLQLAIRFAPAFIFPYYAYQQLLFQQCRHEELLAFSKKALAVRNIYKCTVYKTMGLSAEENLHWKKAKKYYEKSLLYSLQAFETVQINLMLERIKNKQTKKSLKAKKKKKAVH